MRLFDKAPQNALERLRARSALRKTPLCWTGRRGDWCYYCLIGKQVSHWLRALLATNSATDSRRIERGRCRKLLFKMNGSRYKYLHLPPPSFPLIPTDFSIEQFDHTVSATAYRSSADFLPDGVHHVRQLWLFHRSCGSCCGVRFGGQG